MGRAECRGASGHNGDTKGRQVMSRLAKLESLLASEPDDVFLNYSLAMELAKAKRPEEALGRFDRVAELDPDYIASYFHKGKTLLQMGDRERAKEALALGIERAKGCGDQHAVSEMSELLSTL